MAEEAGNAKPRAVVMLGARMEESRGRFKWQFPLYVGGQTNAVEVSGGFSRMRAVQIETARAQASGQEICVLVTGGEERSGQSRAAEAAHQLVCRYGLPSAIVQPIGGPPSTLGNAFTAIGYILGKKGKDNAPQVDIVTNDYHMLRALLMFLCVGFKYSAGHAVQIPQAKIKYIEEYLYNRTSPLPSAVRETRNRIVDCIQPHIEGSALVINPIVAEEIIEYYGESSGDRAAVRYARMLRSNKKVLGVLKNEYKGVLDFIKGQYSDDAYGPLVVSQAD